jgi:formylglycine-generating enzyme required for sulfatase activity
MMKRDKMIRLAYILLGIFSMVLSVLACNSPLRSSDSAPEATPTETQIDVRVSEPELGSTKRWIDGSLLVYIPPGEFIMGSDSEDNPEHEIYLSGFWIYRTEVTNSMYLHCMAMGECSAPAVDPALPDLRDPTITHEPVVGVRWDQAVEYCNFIDGTLTTEAQWEKTARGTDGRLFPWGDDDPTCELLNFNDCEEETTPVVNYPLGASPYEVLDMAGNVFEWVYDWYRDDYYMESPSSNPMGPDYGEERSVRSSTFRSAPEQVESALRYFLDPEEYRADLGFRCIVGNAEEYAPQCVVPAIAPSGGLTDNPDDPPGGSAACVVPQPEVSVVTYCEEGQRGNNISWSPVDADVDYSTSMDAWCVEYDEDTLACAGEEGATVEVEACKSCPPPAVDLGVPATCDPPYVLDEDTQLCMYDEPPIPGEVLCAPGYSLSDDESCCVRTEGSPLDYPVCPVGGDFDPDSNICWFRLPSTGDEKCDSATVFFDSCEQEEEDEPGGGGDGPVCHLNLVGPECEAAGGTPSICSGIVVGTYPCCICD